MRFTVEQPVAAPPAAAAAAFADPAYWATLGPTDDLAAPEVVEHRVEGAVTVLRVAYRFTGQLPAAARRILDPAKLTWVADNTVRVAERRAAFVLRPDFYPDRLTCAGTYRFDPHGDGSVQVVSGDLAVHVPLVGRTVERALVGGVRRHLEAEAAALGRFAGRRPRRRRP